MRILTAALCIVAAACFTSCDDDKDYDHTPPLGKGSIIVDNESTEDTEVYLNSVLVGIAKEDEARIFDLDPGVYRLVLAERDGDRNYRTDIDVLRGRLTILDVTEDYSDSSLYYVVIDFETPD